MDIVDLYMEYGDFREAVKRSGLPAHVAHMKLLKSGCLKVHDKIQFGNAASKLGGQAEELFQKLVPDAVDANRYFKKNNPVYDFMFGNLTIDVKYSSKHTSNRGVGNDYWGFRVKGDQDFIVAFLEREKKEELNNPIVLLLPMSFVENGAKNTTLTESSPYFKEFQIEPEELQPTLRMYSEMREQGLF